MTPTRLKIGDKVKIPAKTAAQNTAPSTVTSPGPATDAGDIYVVKSGHNLTKVAVKYKTTVKELQRLNNLATTQIKVGDKLKVPKPAPTAAGTPPPAQ